MNTKVQKSILAGIIGTAIMTLVMFVAPMMGMPKMSPPEMLSGMLGKSIFVGWIMHFIIGIIFAFSYTYWISKSKITNEWIKGAVFGIIVFVFAKIIMAIMEIIMPMHKMEEASMILTMAGSLIGHIIFGMTVSKTVGNAYCSSKTCETKVA